jgi:hypothetical protein
LVSKERCQLHTKPILPQLLKETGIRAALHNKLAGSLQGVWQTPHLDLCFTPLREISALQAPNPA